MKILTTVIGAMATAAAMAAMPASSAQAKYPSRAITWVVPFSAGGPTDAMARNIAIQVAKKLGVSIVIENVPGAGGTIGTAKVSRAAPDGYTFLVGHVGYMAAAPALYKSLPYDPVKDFDAVFRFPDTPSVLLVNAGSRFKSVEGLVKYASSHPKDLNVGTAGVGSNSDLVTFMFASKLHVEVQPVAYKGLGPALNDLMGGQIDAMFDQSTTALPHVRGGKIRALALTSDEPMKQFPGVPTLDEKVAPGFHVTTWYGLYAPKGTPKALIDTVYGAYQDAMRNQAFTQSMAKQGILLLPAAKYAPAAFQAFTAEEGKRWAQVIKQAGIVPK